MTEPIFQTGYTELYTISAARLENSDPTAYRLARRKGELVLQGAYRWNQGSDWGFEWRDIPIVELDEPEPEPEEPPPDIIRVGDIWEFEADVLVKGSRKVKPMMLQWEVVGWHHGELSWQLKCLDEKVLKPQYIYVFTHEPQYTEMTRIKWGGSND